MQDKEVNPYAPPKSNLELESPVPSEPLFFCTSKSKLILMSICTLGIYDLYWVYKNYVLIKKRTGSDIMPFWRAFFAPLWVYGCFHNIKLTANELNVPEKLPIGFLAIAYFLTWVLWKLPDPLWFISMFACLFLVPANQVALAINKRQNAVSANSEKLTAWNWLAMFIGCLILSLAVFVEFIPKSFFE